jgi:serine/threonine-protein kinase
VATTITHSLPTYNEEPYVTNKLEVPEDQKEMIDSWEEKLSALFGGEIPDRAEWHTPGEIAEVFAAMQGKDAHVFLPGGGGDEFLNSRATDDGLLEWSGSTSSLDNYATVVNPVRLNFWSPGSQTHEANFVLEVGALPAGCPTGYTNDAGVEECVELSKGRYAPRSAWDNSEYEGKDLPASARLVIRATKPARYALFGKGSIYNSFRDSSFDAYSAHHNDAAVFEKIVAEMASIEVA